MRSRYLLVAPLAAAIAIGSSGSTPDAAPTHSRRAGHDDARRSGRAGGHRLQLRHRARARRPQPAAAARQLRSALHGHRRDRQSGDGAFPLADRAVARRACSSRTTSTTCSSPTSCCASTSAATSRWCARAQEDGTTREEEVKARAPQLQQRAGLADRQRDRHRHARRSHPLPRAARQPVQPPDADLDAGERRRAGASRRGVVSRRQAGVERRLRADRRRATTRARISTAGSRCTTAAARRSATRSCSSSPAI